MTLKQQEANPRIRYDWKAMRDMCVETPGEWICEDDPHRPQTVAFDIRHGMPKVFSPAGSFDALTRKAGTYVRYVGVPLVEWTLWDERSFADVERTFDPDLFPPSTPRDLVAIAELHTPAKPSPHELPPCATIETRHEGALGS